jgi:hypothetical protein
MKATSQRRIRANRANARRSTGPRTAAGKARVSMNALRHGLLARQIVLANEAGDNFDAMVAEHVRKFGPADGVELNMIEEMAAAAWRLRRAWAIETRMLDEGVQSAQPGNELARIAAAFSGLASAPQLALIHRYETRLHRMYQRAMNVFLLLRNTKFPNKPNPVFEHLQEPVETSLESVTEPRA